MTELQKAKRLIAAEIATLDIARQRRLSRLIAKMCVVAVTNDRALRAPGPNPIAKIFDVFFNGRPA